VLPAKFPWWICSVGPSFCDWEKASHPVRQERVGFETHPRRWGERDFRMDRSSLLIRKPVSVTMRTMLRKN
jgi:hypothetical protein